MYQCDSFPNDTHRAPRDDPLPRCTGLSVLGFSGDKHPQYVSMFGFSSYALPVCGFLTPTFCGSQQQRVPWLGAPRLVPRGHSHGNAAPFCRMTGDMQGTCHRSTGLGLHLDLPPHLHSGQSRSLSTTTGWFPRNLSLPDRAVVFSEVHLLWTQQMCWWKITRAHGSCLQVSDSQRPRASGKLRKQGSENPPFLRLSKRCPSSFEQGPAESSGRWFPPLQNILRIHALFTLTTGRKKPTEDTFFCVALKYRLWASREGLKPQ